MPNGNVGNQHYQQYQQERHVIPDSIPGWHVSSNVLAEVAVPN